MLGPDVTITGNLKASADLHIDGRIEGDVDCGALVQGAESRIVGTVSAQEAKIGGTIEGKVSVRRLTVEQSAKIHGDVEYETIAIENGAHIDGRLKHTAPVTDAVRLVSNSERRRRLACVRHRSHRVIVGVGGVDDVDREADPHRHQHRDRGG